MLCAGRCPCLGRCARCPRPGPSRGRRPCSRRDGSTARQGPAASSSPPPATVTRLHLHSSPKEHVTMLSSRGILHGRGHGGLGGGLQLRHLRRAPVRRQHRHRQRRGQAGTPVLTPALVTRAHVCRCGACSKGWFDLGGPAWRALTSNMPPGHVYGVRSRWVTCPPRCGQCYEVLKHYTTT